MSRCYVPGCKSGHPSNKETEKVSMFKVPMGKLPEWREAIPQKYRPITVADVICERHFRKEDIITAVKTVAYEYNLKRPRLAKNAIPCIFPDSAYEIEKRLIFEYPNQCDTNETLFSKIMESGIKSVKLPPGSWDIHLIEDCYPKRICISQMGLKRNRPVIIKSVLINKNAITCSIFNHNYLDHDLKIDTTINKLEEFLENFHKLKPCFGGYDLKDNLKFDNPNYVIDEYLNVWRNIKCKITVPEGIRCVCCKGNHRAIYVFERRAAEKRFKIAALRKELNEYRRKQRQLILKNKKLVERLTKRADIKEETLVERWELKTEALDIKEEALF